MPYKNSNISITKNFFQNEVQRVLYKLVFMLVTYPFDHSRRIYNYNPLNFRFIQKLK